MPFWGQISLSKVLAGGLPLRQAIGRISSVIVLVSIYNLIRNHGDSESPKNQNLNAKESNLTGEISEKLIVKLRQKDESKDVFGIKINASKLTCIL
jgi:hypothetical protein